MKSLRLCCLLLACCLTSFTQAGVYTDQLSNCLVVSSSERDKLTLVKWMFTAMSLHPAVSDLALVTDEKRNSSNQTMADLLANLLTERCLAQTEAAIANEGPTSLQRSFSILGQVAAAALFSNLEVAAGLSELDKYLDVETIDRKLGIGQ